MKGVWLQIQNSTKKNLSLWRRLCLRISWLDAPQQVEPLCTCYIFWLNALGHVNSSVRIFNQNNWSGWRYVVHVTTLPVRMYNFLFIPIGSCVKVSVNTSCTRTKMHEQLFIFCIFKCYKLTRPPSSCTWKSLLHRAACCWETPAVREKKTKQIKDQFSRLLNVNEDILQRRSSLGCSCTVNYNQSVMFKQPRVHFVIDFCN